jgi:Ala-tRNA(Pro) deacylase
MSTVFEKIIRLLDENNVEYKLDEHEATITSEDAARIRGVSQSTGAKSMIAKTKDKFVLLVLPGDKRIDWRKVKNILSVKDISLASEGEVLEKTGLVRGSVAPFGSLLEMEEYFDESLLKNEYLNLNAGSVNHSITLKTQDLIKITNPNIVSFVVNDPLLGTKD